MGRNVFRRLTLVAVLVLGVLYVATAGEPAGEEPSALAQQVEKGHELFVQRCEVCHIRGGMGDELRPLNFRFHGTAQGLYNYVSRAMPWGAPGTLTDDEYWAVLAYLLDKHDMLDIDSDVTLGPDIAPEVSLR